MFPDFAELDRQAAESEFLLAQMYDEALSRWVPSVEPFVLPTMADGTAYPPDPDGFTTQTALSAWETLSEAWIAPALMILWCYHHLQAVDALTGPVTAAAARKPKPKLTGRRAVAKAAATEIPAAVETGVPLDLPDPVANAFALAWKQDPDVVRKLVLQVSEMPWSKQQMIDYLGTTKSIRGSVPGQIRDLVLGEISSVRRQAIPLDSVKHWLKQYANAADELYGDGVGDLPRVPINQASGVINHALVTSMQYSEEPLDKVWVAHMDARTRPAHFIADGQRVPKDGKFTVGGHEVDYPGDPDAPIELSIGCRCRVGVAKPGENLPADTHRSRDHQREIKERTAAGQIRAREDPEGRGYLVPAQITSSIYAATSEETEKRMEKYLTFTDALFAVTGTPTDDHRMLAADIELKMRDFPLPLMWQEQTSEGHKGAVGVGVIESMTYKDGEVRGSGYLLNNDNAVKALELIAHGVANPSVDLADATGMLAYEDGTPVTEDNFDETKPLYEMFTSATLTAATIVSIPAFGQTRLALNPDREERSTGLEDAIVAAAKFEQPVYEPALFAGADPNLLSTYRLKMDADTGRVHGFVARWTDQHRSVGLGHIRPPRSQTGYEHFHTSPGVQLTDGTVLPVGRLTVGIGHAPTRGVSAAAAQAHYDNVDSCWAIGRVSEHRLGLFFSGVVAPWASPEKVQMGLASPVSGDWRPIGPGRGLELVAVLSVNTPGFLCKMETDSTGAPLAMVASMGQVDETPTVSWTLDDLKDALDQVLNDREARATEQAAKLALTSRVEQVFTRTVETLGEPPAPLTPTERMAELIAAREA